MREWNAEIEAVERERTRLIEEVIQPLVDAIGHRLGEPGPCHCDLSVGCVCEDCNLWEKVGTAKREIEK